MSGYFVSGEAERDLHELWEYIAADNVDAADVYGRNASQSR